MTKARKLLSTKLRQGKVLKRLIVIPLLIFSFSCFSLGGNLLKAQNNLSQPVSAYLVLGGSILREVYVAQLVKLNPNIPVIISQGSAEPCVFLIFERENSAMDNVWLEKCADSTFTNFVYSIPILKQWGVKKVKIITTDTHLPRAGLLAKILLNAQGIALDLNTIKEERGISANVESPLKTKLDVTRSLGWALISQLISLPCNNIIKLTEVNMEYWYQKGFGCENRANLKIDRN